MPAKPSLAAATTEQLRPRVGRPRVAGSANTTRARIMDAAEELFAISGYDGTSMRDIAAASGIAVAVVTYHFGSKTALFEAVVTRRAGPIGEVRVKALEAARALAGKEPIAIEVLIRNYVAPFILRAQGGDQGWRNYASLMGRLSNSTLGTEVIHRHFDAIAMLYIQELQRTLSGVEATHVVRAFLFVNAAMLFICAATGRSEALSAMLGAPVTSDDPLDGLVAYCAAGLAGLPRS
uniref:TetR/AcrR family transcriptional regulator n=1 Tax=uncultured Sphingomonas sp. TaxID=158754 RepID=UPI0035CA155B